jgi:hypothetical protein
MAKCKDLTKEERIKKEIRRLNSLFCDLGKDKQNVVKSLIENAAFMAVTLEDLQQVINTKGVVSKYKNGENQWGTKKSPEVDIHIAMTKNHTQVMKQLTEMLPDKGGSDISEEILRFAVGGKK